MGWWGLWQTEGYMPCLKDCLKFVADVEMLASVARCLIFFFLDVRDVCVYVKCPNCLMLVTKSH